MSILQIPLGGNEIVRLKKTDAFINENSNFSEKLSELNNNRNDFIDLIFQNSADGMIIFNETGTIVEANPSFCKSINVTHADLIGQQLKNLVPASMQFKLEKQATLLTENDSVRGVLPIKSSDGLFYYEFTTSTLQKDALYFMTFRNVTEKRKIEEKIKKNEELYKDLFTEALDGIIFWSGKGKIVDANEAACRIFECSYQELLTKKIEDFILPKDERFYQINEKLLEMGAIREELVFLMPNGQEKSLEFTVKLHALEGFHLTIFRNVSDRRRMEMELRESEVKFRKVFEGSLEGIILWNEHYHIVDINYAGEKLLQVSKSEVIDRCFVQILKSYSIGKEELDEHFENLQKYGHTTGTIAITHETGRISYIEFSAKHHIFSKVSFVSFKDVTEKMEMEEQFKKSDTLHVVGELAAGIAHEIRNPMTSLKGFIQLLEDSIQEDYSMYFNIISSELKRIDSIINEFLILAKPQAVLHVEKDITQIMKETVELLNAQAVLHNVQFRTYYEEGLPPLYCEPNQLKKVFINLIKNAVEVMPKGGFITISMESTLDGRIHIYIQDEGCGIPEDKVKKLGQPFYTTKERGTGLGLMVTFKIIEEHDGTISIESELGVGTVFHIYLPLDKRRKP